MVFHPSAQTPKIAYERRDETPKERIMAKLWLNEDNSHCFETRGSKASDSEEIHNFIHTAVAQMA